MLTRLRLCSAAILLAPSAGLRLFAPSAGLRLRGFARPLATAAPSMSMVDAALPTLEDLTDPREWLEEVEGDKQIGWVKEQNADAVARIGEPSDKPLYGRLLEIMESDEKIPYIGRVLNGLYYNFWQDETHVQGIWRRCTLDEYRKAEPEWELVLDLDALSAESGVSWVWGGSTLLDEGPGVRKDRVMVSLSRGGADAKVSREFDLEGKEFVAVSDGGFELPEAKSQLSYKDRDTLLVGGVFGEEEMTDSGYPRTVYEWRRGTPLSEATKVYEGEKSDVAVSGYAYLDRGHRYELRSRSITFYTSAYEVRRPDGSFSEVPVPEDADIETFADQLLVTLRTAWLGHEAGALLAAPLEPFLDADGDEARRSLLVPLFTPTESCSLEGSSATKSRLVLSVLQDVVNESRFWRYAAGAWSLEQTVRSEGYAVSSFSAVDAEAGDAVWTTTSSYTQPTALSLADAGSPLEQEPLKSLPAFFNADGLKTQQLFAKSADGTRVPYFLVSKEGLPLDGSTPTLLYGYGGFEISLTPSYSAGIGAAWLEKGHAYVQANIRGGGEYGPRWHQAALKEKRSKAYEDFEAVARDLISRGVTSPAKLGCQGGSNGGLLTGNMLARPTAGSTLFGAIVCQVPLLDMRRFHKLLAGASWMGEYGDPDTDDWSFLQRYSPYHNLDEATAYPPILVTTSTRDDRVHPGHARKLVSKLLDLGKGPSTFYYENIEGGHGGAANNKQRAFMSTLAYSFLEQTLASKNRGE
mmetsp:Transcript_21644/g.70657  ORF Transcript_21644/g.70657 Transcript_21644/m.70657 type:complete len:750 (-) Transcript_21644:153-2402(-)